MSAFDRIWNAAKVTIEMHGDVQRALKRLDSISESVFDHEKRLVRIETMIEMTRGGGLPRLP